MIRFRFEEDERRFVRLHSEMFERIARAGLRDVAGSDTLRNVGKIEQMAYMEGIRQGLAMAAITTEMVQAEAEAFPEPHAQKAFQLHALIYGSSDTPLRSVEKEWLAKLELDADHLAKSWLDDKPMRFAPATLQELDGTSPPIAPMMSVQAPRKPMPVKALDATESADAAFRSLSAESRAALSRTGDAVAMLLEARTDRLPSQEAMHGSEVTEREPWQKGEYEPDDDLLAPVSPRALFDDADDDKEIQPESPEFLDVVRDAIQVMRNTGWDPKNWQDLVLGLHRHMGVDAGFLDIQLTTHVGRTVLDQCGLAGMAPPEMMSFEFLSDVSTRPTPAAPPSLGEPAEGPMRFGKAHGLDDER